MLSLPDLAPPNAPSSVGACGGLVVRRCFRPRARGATSSSSTGGYPVAGPAAHHRVVGWYARRIRRFLARLECSRRGPNDHLRRRSPFLATAICLCMASGLPATARYRGFRRIAHRGVGNAASSQTSNSRTCERVELRGPGAALLSFRERAVRALTEPLRGDMGLAAAISCGWRAGLPESVYRQFQVSGLAHVVAVSGAHLSIVAALMASMLGALRVPKPISVAAQIMLLAAYLALTAMPASAIRATLMTLAGMTSWTARRRASSLSALGCCIAVMIALDAQAALSTSFALSVLATLGIVVFGGLANSWLKACLGWLPAFVREALALTFASSVLATPFSAALFSQLPLAAPVANIAIVPLFGPVCAAGIVGAVVCAMLPLPGVVASITCASASLLLKVVQACASIPYASIPIVAPAFVALLAGFVSACVLWLWWPKPDSHSAYRLLSVTGIVCAVVFALLKAPIPYGGCEIVALDVGQGDAILVRSGGHSVLVDTGNQDALLRQALARHHITRLDALVVTHPDDDHMGSLASLDGVVQVDRVLLARDGLACSCASCAKLQQHAETLVGKNRVEGLSQGDKFRLGAFEFTCVWPVAFQDEGGNGDSLCFTVDADIDGDGNREWRSLLVGDAEHEEVSQMLSAGLIDGVDVYKVGHHWIEKRADARSGSCAVAAGFPLLGGGKEPLRASCRINGRVP